MVGPSREDPDRELFDAWCGGDNRAGSELLRRHVREITWFFRNKVFAESDVPDLVSQTFLRCVGAKDRFRRETSVRRFLYSIAHNVLREYIRTKAKREREEVDFSAICVRDLAPRSMSSMQMHRVELQAFVNGLRRVPIDSQVVLEMKYFEGLTGPQIAARLGVPEGTVRTRLRRGVIGLREAVAKELPHTAAAPVEVSVEDLETWAEAVRRRPAPDNDGP